MRRHHYLLEHSAVVVLTESENSVAKQGAKRRLLCLCCQSHNWVYESCDCLSLRHPLLVFLLVPVSEEGGCCIEEGVTPTPANKGTSYAIKHKVLKTI